MAESIKINYGSGRPTNVQRTVAELLQEVARSAQSWLFQNDRIASGETINGFLVRVDRKSKESTRYILSGAPQTPFALQGRNAGKFPWDRETNSNPLRKWIDEKGIQPPPSGEVYKRGPKKGTEKPPMSKDELAFLIARKIAQDGTNQPRLTDNDIDEFFFDAYDRYGGLLADEAAIEVADITTNLFKKSGFKIIKVKTS